MSLYSAAGVVDPAQITRAMQHNAGTDVLALATEEYGTMVEHTVRRKSALEGFVPMRPVRGTTTLTDFASVKANWAWLLLAWLLPPMT